MVTFLKLREWQEKAGEHINSMILRYLTDFNNIAGWEQTGAHSWLPRRKPEDSELDISHTLENQFNLLRIVDNDAYPAFFRFRGNKYILKIEKDSSS